MSRKRKRPKPTGSFLMQPCAQGNHAACDGGPVLCQHPDTTANGDFRKPLVRGFVCTCDCGHGHGGR